MGIELSQLNMNATVSEGKKQDKAEVKVKEKVKQRSKLEDDCDYEHSSDSEDEDAYVGEKFHDSDYDLEDDEDDKVRKDEWNQVLTVLDGDKGLGFLEDGASSDIDWAEPGDEIEIEELQSQTSSDSEAESVDKEKIRTHNRFKSPVGNADVFFEVGQKFASKKEFQMACKHHGTVVHRNIQFKRTNKQRCSAHCVTAIKGKCLWFASVNYRKATETWEMTTVQRHHSCSPTFNHSCANAEYLSQRYKEDLRIMPKMGVKDIIEKARRDLYINISRAKAFNARKLAKSQIDGEWMDQYDTLRAYCDELLRGNPNSTVLLQTEDNPGGKPIFSRMYVCLDACKRGFLEGCRPIIGIDGCHLYGKHKGILLAAIGLDANDQIFPVAYAVVEIENKSAWLWFLTALQEDLHIDNSERWTVISDKQKGIRSAIQNLLPDVEHRLCTWHMYKNFKSSFSSLELKELVWAAAKCTHEELFKKKMKDIETLNPAAYEWILEKTRAKEWSRAYFKTHSKCDILVNNICECFNRVIGDARDKPIVTLFEALRFYFMDRLQKKRVFLEKMQGQFGPKVTKKLQKNMAESNRCFATHSGCLEFQVRCLHGGQYEVHLQERYCGCRRWQLTGIPCPHAITAISFIREEPQDFMDPCYSKERYFAAYKYIVHPLNGPDLWPKRDDDGVLPPNDQRRIGGRPAKARKKDAQERKEMKNKKNGDSEKLSRVGKNRRYRCSVCSSTGHNVKNYPVNAASSSGTATSPTKKTQVANPPKNQDAKKRKRSTCSSCKGTGHNKATCKISVASASQPRNVDYGPIRGDEWRFPE